MTFIEDFMQFAEGSEAPRSYWFWSAIATISAIVKRNVWIQRPTWITYPNIYVFLVGESGLRKSAPVSIAKDLVGAVNNTRLISGRNSVQGIITSLGTAYTLSDGNIIDKAYGFISASEFASSIVRDPDSLTILTDLYDSCYHDKWTDTLRSGKVELIEPYVTILAGINPPHFEDFISPTQVEGGFVARLLLVFENEKACINPAVRIDKEKPSRSYKELLPSLREIAKVKGEMKWTEEALELYENWYIEFEKNKQKKKIRDKTGAINRVGENILKVAIILSLSRKLDTTLEAIDIKDSLDICLTSLSSVNKTTVGQGKTQYAPQTKLVLMELFNTDDFELGRSKLLRSNYGAIDSFDLDRVVDSLMQAGAVKQEKRGSEIYYMLTQAAKTQLKGFV